MSTEAIQVDNDEKFNRLGFQDISKLLLEFSVPALIGLITQALYNIIDAIYVGHGVGEYGLAATTVVFPGMIVIAAIAVLIGYGGNSLAAIKLGEHKKSEAEKILANTIVLSVLFYLVAAVLVLAFLDPLLTFSGATSEVLPYAREFLSIIILFGIFDIFAFGLSNFIRTSGYPNTALATMVVGVGVNVILGYLFVIVFAWGMKGAAFATGCSWVVSTLYVFAFFLSKRSPLKLRRENFKLDVSTSLNILKLGVPMAFLQIGMALIVVVQNYLITTYGALDAEVGASGGLAAMSVLGRIGYLSIVPAVGIAQGAQPIFGFNYGARNYGRILETLKKAILAAFIIMFVFWLVIMVYPEVFVRLFGLEGRHIDYTAQSLRLYLLVVPIIAYQIIGANYFQSSGQALKATLLTLTRQIFFLIPLLFVAPLILPKFVPISALQSIYLAESISDFFSVALVAAFLVPEMRKLKRLAEQAQEEGVQA